MTTINATVVACNGATYSPLHKMFGIRIQEVPGADFRSVSAKLDLSSPEAYVVSYRELLDKLEIPEEWKVVPMEVLYNPSDDEADISQALIAQGCHFPLEESFTAWKDSSVNGVRENLYDMLVELANGADVNEVSEKAMARRDLVEEAN